MHWIAVIAGLAGVVVGNLLSYFTQASMYKRETRRRNSEFIRDKLWHLASAISDIRNECESIKLRHWMITYKRLDYDSDPEARGVVKEEMESITKAAEKLEESKKEASLLVELYVPEFKEQLEESYSQVLRLLKTLLVPFSKDSSDMTTSALDELEDKSSEILSKIGVIMRAEMDK